MTDEKRIREKYGFTQADLADYLSVSLSLLKLTETGARSLPTPALLKFLEIVLFDAQQDATTKSDETIVTEAAHTTMTYKKLSRAVQKTELQLYVAQRQLEKIQTGYEQAQRLLALCHYFLEKKPAEKTDMLWLESQQYAAQKRLQRYSPNEQAYLQWKIACLQFGIEKGKEIVNKDSNAGE